MKPKTVILLFFFASQIGAHADHDVASIQQDTYILPWKVIAATFDDKRLFCTQSYQTTFSTTQADSNSRYLEDHNISGDQIVTCKHIQFGTIRAPDANISIWNHDRWQQIGRCPLTIDASQLKLDAKLKASGFYRFELNTANKINPTNEAVYAIVGSDWKKDFLTFCREQKEECESQPDPQLLRSSIVVSHFDNVMEIVSKTPFLSECALKALTQAVESKRDFMTGKCPQFVVGLNKLRIKCFPGATLEEFVVFIPNTLENTKSPLGVFWHPDNKLGAKNYSASHGVINIWWHTVTDKNIDWKSFETILTILKQQFKIDENRMYVNGECGNGLAAMSLVLPRPDLWAQASISLGNTYRHLAGNALNVNLIYVKGGHTEDYLIGYYDFAVACFNYYGCRCLTCSRSQSTSEILGPNEPRVVRCIRPTRVLYTMESPANPKAYWVKIEGRKDENFNATIDASVQDQKILIKTKNIDAYSLDLLQAPIDSNRSVEVVENGQSLGFVRGPSFKKTSPKYKDAMYIKNEHLSGPVSDVFTDPYVVVWGSATENRAAAETNKKAAQRLAGAAPCFADANFPEHYVSTHNLVIVGTPENNKCLANIADKLPVRITAGRYIADQQTYDKINMGIMLVYPNPQNPSRYVAIFSGTSEKAISSIGMAYFQMKSAKPADIAIFQVEQNDKIKWLRLEKFNTVWNWHDQWNQMCFASQSKHPLWQWRQWLAKAIKQQLGADVVVLEDSFESTEPIPQGRFSFRDVCSIFKNDWIVKISVDGKNLRDMLMVPFKDDSAREASSPVIVGVSLIKTQNEPKDHILNIDEIIADKKYTVAFPYKALNGKRLGLVMNNYTIVDEAFLILLLEEYLSGKPSIDIDAELDAMKLNMF